MYRGHGQSVTDVGDRKLIAFLKPTVLDAMTVDPDPIGAAKIPDEHRPLVHRHTAVVARNAKRVKPSIALGMATDDDHRAVQHDIHTIIERHETRGH